MGRTPSPMVTSGRAGAPPWNFFLVYGSKDKSWAEWIAWQLEAADYRVLLEAWDFVPGVHGTARTAEGIKKAERLLVILSHSSPGSILDQARWQAAWRQDPEGLGRKVIPVRVEDCDCPPLLDAAV